MKNKKIILLATGLLIFPLMFVVASCSQTKTASQQHASTPAKAVDTYICPMHPEVRQDKPGTCPICNMNLEPIKKDSGEEKSAQQQKAVLHYTCPMHPQIQDDQPGHCPICNMNLVAVYKDDGAHLKDGNQTGVTISNSRQELIGVKSEPVLKKEVDRVIRTTGRVAFDPKLAVAIREYQELSRTVPSLKNAAIARLRHLGLSDEEIKEIKPGHDYSTHYHLLTEQGSMWVYATLYENEAALIQGGEKVEIEVPGMNGKIVQGRLRSLFPLVDSSTRSIQARIEIPQEKARTYFRPDTFVTVNLKLDLGEQLVVPKSAVIQTGEREVVFVQHGKDHFQEQAIQIGPEVNHDYYVIESGLSEGDLVVASAAFLVDSEARLKGALSGGHQH